VDASQDALAKSQVSREAGHAGVRLSFKS